MGEIEPLVKELHFALRKLEDANLPENQPDSAPQKWALYMRDTVIPAMDDVRDVARPVLRHRLSLRAPFQRVGRLRL